MLVQLGMLCTDGEMSNVEFSLVNLSFFCLFFIKDFSYSARDMDVRCDSAGIVIMPT